MQKNTTIIFATQDLKDAEAYAERIAILNDGAIQMDGTLDKLIETTHGLSRYRLLFKENIKDEFFDQIKDNPRIQKVKINGRELEFYTRDRQEFFKVLEIAIKDQLSDLDSTRCDLQDLFLGLTDGGLE